MFRRNKNFAPITPASTPESQKVIDTLETASYIDPEQVVLVGSAALAIMGVVLEPDPNHPDKPRPGDVDMTSTTAEMRRQVNKLHNFSPVAHNNIPSSNSQTVIRSHLSDPLPIDLISRFNRSFIDDPESYDLNFLKFWRKHSSPIEGTDFRMANTSELKYSLLQNKEPKYSHDYTNLLNRLNKR